MKHYTLAMASRDGKYMLEESPEKRPATPMMITTNHFCLLLKIWKGCSEAGRCAGSATLSGDPELSFGRSASACASSRERKGFAGDLGEKLLKPFGACEKVRLCSSALESLVVIEALSSKRPHSGSKSEFRFDSKTTEETVDPGPRYTPRPTSRHPSMVVNRLRSTGLSSALAMTDVGYVHSLAAVR